MVSLHFREQAITVPDKWHLERWITIGEVDGGLLVVVHVDVEEITGEKEGRIGSFRRAGQPNARRKTTVVDARDALEQAKKTQPVRESQDVDTSDIPETRFSGPSSVRGEHYEKALAASGLVQLDPDLREAFADAASVNRALRQLVDIAKQMQRRSEP